MPDPVPRRCTRRRVVQVLMAALVPPLHARVQDQPRRPSGPDEGWQSLFDGRTLGGWEPTLFGGEGEVHVDDGRIVLEQGNDLTGITWKGQVPAAVGYELALEAMRVSGGDFFCGLTFPVMGSSCSLIVGGWAGSLVGLSSLDGLDASENETTTRRTFDNGRWYAVRVRVTEHRIQAWIDDEPVVDAHTAGRKVGVRNEMLECRPLGVASWRTKAALRGLRWRFEKR